MIGQNNTPPWLELLSLLSQKRIWNEAKAQQTHYVASRCVNAASLSGVYSPVLHLKPLLNKNALKTKTHPRRSRWSRLSPGGASRVKSTRVLVEGDRVTEPPPGLGRPAEGSTPPTCARFSGGSRNTTRVNGAVSFDFKCVPFGLNWKWKWLQASHGNGWRHRGGLPTRTQSRSFSYFPLFSCNIPFINQQWRVSSTIGEINWETSALHVQIEPFLWRHYGLECVRWVHGAMPAHARPPM